MTIEQKREYSRQYYATHKEKFREYGKTDYYKNKTIRLASRKKEKLKSRYGITIEEYNKMNSIQNGLCAICGIPSTKTLDVDHNHTTGKVRKLLCRHCNMGIGYFKENTAIMSKAIQYLNENNLC